ncbi:MAG: PQ-loop repeat-containing protein [Minisyncoccia bacterium]|jgi:uncharacterized protein with PQ loop repeat
MNDAVFQSLGLIASIVFVSAYAPQIIHLLKVKDSTGIDIPAWFIWLFGALILVAYAIHEKDVVFMTLTILESLALLTVIILSARYKRR